MKNIVILGKFDGIHIGHTALINAANNISEKTSMNIVVYTIGSPSGSAITQKKDRNDLLYMLGANEIIEQELNDTFRNLTPEQFVNNVLKSTLSAGVVIVGEDFRFGRNRCADAHALKTLCQEVDIDTLIIDTVRLDMYGNGVKTVSSSDIRSLIESGNVKMAKKALGRSYFIKGEVMHGKHLGTKLGFPTVNIYPDDGTLLPADGVYATRVEVDGIVYSAITNVGNNPTVEHGDKVKIETHILDFEDDCYGKIITISFEDFIRGEIRFDSIDELKARVFDDIKKSKEILNNK